MPRNNLKSFPAATRLRGLAHICAACHVPVQPPIDPPDLEPALRRGSDSPRVPASVIDLAPAGSMPPGGEADRQPDLLQEAAATLHE